MNKNRPIPSTEVERIICMMLVKIGYQHMASVTALNNPLVMSPADGASTSSSSSVHCWTIYPSLFTFVRSCNLYASGSESFKSGARFMRSNWNRNPFDVFALPSRVNVRRLQRMPLFVPLTS